MADAAPTTSDRLERLAEQVRKLPDSAGVYFFKDPKGRLLYVGKAESLRDRVRSYLQDESALSPKIQRMVSQAETVDYLLTDSPVQALIWEQDLVRKEQPRYNTKLRDDKHYPYLRIDVQNPWPVVRVTRRMEKDGARYFGPFPHATSVRQTMDTLSRLFPHILCNRTITGTDPRACLYLHIKRCPAPCIGLIDESGYREIVDDMVRFLEGKNRAVLDHLCEEMEAAAEAMEFEKAADLRDRLRAAERVIHQEKVAYSTLVSQDVIGLAREGGNACAQVFTVREGRLARQDPFIMVDADDESGRDILTAFVKQFYSQATELPEEVLVPEEIDEQETIRAWLTERRGRAIRLLAPRRGEKHAIVELATKNAAEALERMQAEWLENDQKLSDALMELQEYLNLPNPPQRMECYDISNTQGTNSVASMVVFEGGQPKRSDYRRFQIKGVVGANDFASHQEVLRRRFKRTRAAREEQEAEDGHEQGDQEPATAWEKIPDLVIIDGGKGQLSAALEVMDELDMTEIPVVGLAKENEEIFVKGRSLPIMLPRSSQSLFLVQRIRDEAHRFAITYHRKLRGKRSLKSLLDEVPGIGPKRKKELIKTFGSMRGIRDASVEELTRVSGVTPALAEQIKAHLG